MTADIIGIHGGASVSIKEIKPGEKAPESSSSIVAVDTECQNCENVARVLKLCPVCEIFVCDDCWRDRGHSAKNHRLASALIRRSKFKAVKGGI